MSHWISLLVFALAIAGPARYAQADCNAPNPDERDRVELRTPIAAICFDLLGDPNEAPLSVANFLNYVEDGAYDGSFIHRLAPGFVLQGGGYSYDSVTRYDEIPEDPSVLNEPGISNLRGTVALAKISGQPDSATNQFFINLADNSANLDSANDGFTVFARVVPEDMAVVDALAALHREFGPYVIDDPLAGAFNELPVTRVLDHKRQGCVRLKSDLNPDGSPRGKSSCIPSSVPNFDTSIQMTIDALDPQVPERLVTLSSAVRNPEPLCPSAPNKCRSAAKASLSISEKSAGKEKLKLSLSGFSSATTQDDFGDPVAGTSSYAMCLYDDANLLVGELAVERAQLLCGKKLGPCWKSQSTKGYAFKDADGLSDGVRKLSATSGVAGKGKLQLSASNNQAKEQIGMPTGLTDALEGTTSATVQIQAGELDCFTVQLTNVKAADGVDFKASN